MFHWAAARARWRRAALSHSYQSLNPSPVRADSADRSNRRIDLAGIALQRSTSKRTCGSRSILLISISRQRTEHVRIFDRLVVALGHRQHHHLGPFAEIEQRRTDQVADVLDQTPSRRPAVKLSRPRASMSASRWQPVPVLTWITGAPVARMRSASLVVAWSPSTT